MMTPNKEDYLKCIHEIGERYLKITNKHIAEILGISAPSVSEMLKKMLAEELIVKDQQTGYKLSPEGLRAVSNLYRKHRIIEVFLVDYLNYSAQAIHDEAEILEHSVSDSFIDRLEERLGYPNYCPHGGTIPRKGQELVENYSSLLHGVRQPTALAIRRVYDNDLLLQYLEQNQLSIGQTFQLVTYDDFGKTWSIQCDDKHITIPEPVAKQIFVEIIS